MTDGVTGDLPVVGFVGLGTMGRPMALNLLRAGYELVVHSRSEEPVAGLVGAGARRATSSAMVAASTTVVITMLPGPREVEAVVAGDGGLLDLARPGSLIIDMSTIDPAVARQLAERASAEGVDLLDAPVSGGASGARDATLSIMVGGSRAAFDRALPLLRALGQTVVHCGPSGAGQVTKACNQLVIAAEIQAVAEALVLAQAAGVEPALVRQALLGGYAASRVLEVHGRRMLEHDFDSGGRAELHLKDVRIAMEIARRVGVPLAGLAPAAESLEMLVRSGGGRLDHAALVTVIEAASGVRVGTGLAEPLGGRLEGTEP